MIRPLMLASIFLLAAPLATPALSLVSAERGVDARKGQDEALYVFTHRHVAAGRLAGGVPLACNMAGRPDLPCIPSGAVADVLGVGGDCGLVDLVGLRVCLDIAADLTSGGDALHVWR